MTRKWEVRFANSCSLTLQRFLFVFIVFVLWRSSDFHVTFHVRDSQLVHFCSSVYCFHPHEERNYKQHGNKRKNRRGSVENDLWAYFWRFLRRVHCSFSVLLVNNLPNKTTWEVIFVFQLTASASCVSDHVSAWSDPCVYSCVTRPDTIKKKIAYSVCVALPVTCDRYRFWFASRASVSFDKPE